MRLSRGFDILHQVADLTPPGRLSPARRRLWTEAVNLVQEEQLLDPAYSYDFVPIERPVQAGDRRIHVGGVSIEAPNLIPASGSLTALAFAAATVGAKLESRVSTLFAEKRTSLAVMLDELGNHLLFAVLRRASDKMLADTRRKGLSMAGELHAGDPGLDLAAQRVVLDLAQADCIGVELKANQWMNPLKSGTAVFGVGIDLPATTWSRCDQCPSRQKCRVGDQLRIAA